MLIRRTTGMAIAIVIVLSSSATGEEPLCVERDPEECVDEARQSIDAGTSAPDPPPSVPTVTWNEGKTTFATESASVTLSNRVQIRYTRDDPDDGEGRGSFRVRRAKTKFEGWFYSRNLGYELQLNWADSSNPLEDANIQWDMYGNRVLTIRAGQFKVPFGLQELTSSGSQQFVDRSIVSNEFAKGRDVGVQLGGVTLGSWIDWRAGVFNGNGRNRSANDNGRFQYDARVAFQPFGEVSYSESDFESRDRPLFAVAVQYERNDARGSTPGNDLSRTVRGGDVVFKFRGFSVFAEYFARENEPELGPRFDSTGLAAQAGYFVIPRRLEIALRRAELDPSDRIPGDDRTETGAAVNWFIHRHSLKLQSDFREILDDATEERHREGRLQLQFIF
jgi:phosphate-selective porin OprO and OprP